MAHQAVAVRMYRHTRVATVAFRYVSAAGTNKRRCEATAVKEHEYLPTLFYISADRGDYRFTQAIIGVVPCKVYEAQ